MRTLTIISTALLLAFIGGCGGSSDSGGGRFSLSLTDAPVDSATRVVISFTAIEIQPQGSERISIPLAPPRVIDLMTLSDGRSETLLNGVELPGGHYEWIRLDVDDGASFITVDGEDLELRIPSEERSGLKLNRGFDVAQGQDADFTVDFDLRRSVRLTAGGYKLRPTLRIVDNQEVGTLAGTVSKSLLDDPSCTGGFAVYVFSGGGVTPDDADDSEPDPLTSAIVKRSDPGGDGSYTVGFLAPGTYTAAFTCQALADDPAANDSIVFRNASNATITADATTILNF